MSSSADLSLGESCMTATFLEGGDAWAEGYLFIMRVLYALFPNMLRYVDAQFLGTFRLAAGQHGTVKKWQCRGACNWHLEDIFCFRSSM